ncbi:uncharacterized protein M421DRAFT_423954 [Didymella exigua CBS 183.55]|uniref:Uncharacterized protein n=1 Tax=Didymella exigua CBS 183.55 TaxID=1150837 RepID=A0A6A5RHU7_9PLEO|nr:uncharacterized protein M421DRAFT_423954 [Didymella exigua CBS 183.55]KAF1925177.1 hypothetical protein M421DRAFT_423954 [Didymella exigua CBS 183.55]
MASKKTSGTSCAIVLLPSCSTSPISVSFVPHQCYVLHALWFASWWRVTTSVPFTCSGVGERFVHSKMCSTQSYSPSAPSVALLNARLTCIYASALSRRSGSLQEFSNAAAHCAAWLLQVSEKARYFMNETTCQLLALGASLLQVNKPLVKTQGDCHQ